MIEQLYLAQEIPTLDFSCPKLEHTEEDLRSLGEKAKQKFPLDMFQNIPSGGASGYCPQITLPGYRTPPLCWMSDFLGYLKIPVFIGFLVWCVVSL